MYYMYMYSHYELNYCDVCVLCVTIMYYLKHYLKIKLKSKNFGV